MIGKTISHYRIVEEIGRGGMGVVYKAEDTKLERTVALKFLPSETLEGDEEDKARFLNEARAAAALNHPNICTIHEISDTDGHTFISMAYIDGRELSDIVKEGPLPLDQAVGVATQVAQGLEEAHEHDIVHRDVKASNVMITGKGRALVMDFGLAKRSGRAALTKMGMSMGTIDYMSPEQAQGGRIDHRTDIWSFGVMLYEMIAGERPFRAEFEQAIVYSILNADPRPLGEIRGDVPAALDRIVQKCMAKNPADRYQRMSEVLDELRAVRAELGIAPESSSLYSSAVTQIGGGPGVRRAARRVPQVLLLYAAVALGIWLGLGWLVRHFPLSPHLPNFSLIALASLMPTVLLLTLAGGDGGRRRAAQIGVPANLLLSVVLLVFLFQNKDLGAATETVMVVDDQGNRVARVVPKSEFRKRVAIFYPDNETGNPQDDWLQYGLIYALAHDLYQDLFVAIGMGFTRSHERAGFPDATGSPLTLKRKLADDEHYPFFVAGSFMREGNDIVMTSTLYETKKGNPIETRTYRGDVFTIVDAMSAQLRRDLDIPDYHIEESIDLPVRELLTSSEEALRNYILGNRVSYEDADFAKAAELLERAVAIDPSFAPAHWDLYDVYAASNRPNEAMRAIETAMQHRYRLPEPVQFALKDDYYDSKQLMDEALENAERWASLYPQDPGAYEALASHYERLKRYDDGVNARLRILELDPGDFNQLRWISRLYQSGGNFASALEYLQRYAELFPDNYESFADIGRLYQVVGELESAKDYYKKSLVIEPDRMDVRTALADLERRTGNFNSALEHYQEALASAKSARDSVSALIGLRGYFVFRGQMDLAIGAHEQTLAEARKYWSPIGMMFFRLFSSGFFVLAGRTDEAFAMLAEIESGELIPQLRPIVNAGYLIAYGAMDDPANADQVEKHLEAYTEWVDQTKNDQYRWPVYYCRGAVQRWRGDSAGALENVRKAIELIAQDETENLVQMNAFAAMCSRETGSYELGISFLENALALEPYHPWAHYEYAEILEAMGNRDEAISHLKKVLYVYEPADGDYRYAREARELATRWGLASVN